MKYIFVINQTYKFETGRKNKQTNKRDQVRIIPLDDILDRMCRI